jgi:hypothetical protein
MSDTATAELPHVAESGKRAAQVEWLAKVLGVVLSAETAGPRSGGSDTVTVEATASANKSAGTAAPAREVSIVALQKSRIAWDNLRKAIQSQLQSLEKAILQGITAHNQDPSSPDKFDPKAATESTKRLYTLLDGLDADLIDKLDEALNASGEDRMRHQAEAKKLIEKYQTFVAGDPLIKAIDGNGFITTTIGPSVEKTLSVLAQNL